MPSFHVITQGGVKIGELVCEESYMEGSRVLAAQRWCPVFWVNMNAGNGRTTHDFTGSCAKQRGTYKKNT